jgi:glucokinase
MERMWRGAMMSSVLLGDIGGTKSRFALADPGGRPERIEIISDDTIPDLETAVAQYLDKMAVRPDAAVLAIAAPVDGEEIAFTNRPWRFRRSDFARRFGFTRLRIVNDFEAVAWALPQLGPSETRPLGRPLAPRDAVKVVFGPGTGLGVAALIPVERRWHAIAGEGGHVCFGPQRADEIEVFRRLLDEYGWVSAEKILCGPGFVRLAHALDPQAPWHASESILAAVAAGDPAAQRVARLFARLLGRFAGDLALTFKAQGGVYIAGGVGSGLGPLLDEAKFRSAFEAHPPHAPLLATIPTLLITCREPGLIGCAALANEFAASARH